MITLLLISQLNGKKSISRYNKFRVCFNDKAYNFNSINLNKKLLLNVYLNVFIKLSLKFRESILATE